MSGAFRETVQRAAGDEFLALARASNARIRLQKHQNFSCIYRFQRYIACRDNKNMRYI